MVQPDWNGVTKNQRTGIQNWWVVICIRSLNIRTGQAGGLETALPALQQGNIGIRFLQETKLTRGIHTRFSSGYKVCETEAEIRHRGGFSIIWIEEKGWQVVGTRSFGTNVVSFKVTSGQKL